MSFDEEMAAARGRVAEFDKIDRYRERGPGAIAAALEAGLRNPEGGAQYDALVMLRHVAFQQSRIAGGLQ